jgi:hypothetical protein
MPQVLEGTQSDAGRERVLSERELKHLYNAQLFESLIPFVVLFEEDEETPLPRRRSCKVKYEYDFRVAVANARSACNGRT